MSHIHVLTTHPLFHHIPFTRRKFYSEKFFLRTVAMWNKLLGGDAHLITTLLTTTCRGSTVVYLTYPYNVQPLLPLHTPLQHPHSVIIYLEWHVSFVLYE